VEELMPISELELANLKSRVANAIRTNTAIALADGHIETLKAVLGKEGLAKVKSAGSATRYLYQLILQAETQGVRISESVPTPEATPEPIPESEPTPVIEVTEKVVIEEEPEPQAIEEAPVKVKETPKGKKGKKDKLLN